MVPFIRYNQQYFILAACLVLIALFHRFQSNSHTSYYQEAAVRQQQQRPIQREVLRSAVSGTIGIDESRGDSISVSSY